MASNLPPVPKEQAFLETFFQCLQKFAYDKAKEIADKERESSKAQPSSMWSHLVQCLGHFATAEKAYSSLLFLGQNISLKFFGRKDSLKTSYSYVRTELRKLEDSSSKQVSAPAGEGENLEQLFGHLCGQLCQYIAARQKMVEFYEQMLLTSQNKCIVYEDLQLIISHQIQSNQKLFHHPILSPIRSNFILECEVINQLLLAQVQLQEWEFLHTLLHLQDAHSKLAVWAANAAAKEGKRLAFGGSSRYPLPPLYVWITKFKALLVSKFSLYFYDILRSVGAPGEMKNLMAKASVDFYGKLVTFQKKSDAACICLVLDTNGKAQPYQGAGYHHPKKQMDPPQGIDSYPPILLCPAEKPERHWPSVISILTERASDLDMFEKVVYVCDEILKQPVTYFLTRVEPRVTLIVIFETKKAEKEGYVNNVLTDLCSQLRCSKLFLSLKPGVK